MSLRRHTRDVGDITSLICCAPERHDVTCRPIVALAQVIRGSVICFVAPFLRALGCLTVFGIAVREIGHSHTRPMLGHVGLAVGTHVRAASEGDYGWKDKNAHRWFLRLGALSQRLFSCESCELLRRHLGDECGKNWAAR